MRSVVYRLSGAKMSKYRIILQPNGLHRVEKKVGFLQWRMVELPRHYDPANLSHAINWAEYLNAVDIEEKNRRDRVVWKL